MTSFCLDHVAHFDPGVELNVECQMLNDLFFDNSLQLQLAGRVMGAAEGLILIRD